MLEILAPVRLGISPRAATIVRIRPYKRSNYHYAVPILPRNVQTKHFCELASENLTNFTYADKRLALEALRIEAWINNEDILIKGAIPAYDLASTQLKPGHRG